MAGEDENPVTERRLQMLEELVRAFGPAVTRIETMHVHLEAIDEKVDGVSRDLGELRRDLRDDRRESRNRTLLALGPIALAALAIAGKVLFGVDFGGAP